MELQFKFNGVVVNHPDDWKQFELSVERSQDLLGLVNKYVAELTFSGDAYDALVSSITTNGFCEPIVALVQIRESKGAWLDLIEGSIFPTYCDFDRQLCTFKTKIYDNSYMAKIQNNQKIKAHIEVPRSKNDVTITAAVSKQLDLFTPSTGAYDFTGRTSYTINEVLKFLVAFMTDGTVDYVSSAFGLGGDYQFWLISAGQEVREGGGVLHPYLSFYEVIQELNKKTPIGFGIEDNGGTPRIRIEKKEYFRNEAVTAFTARNIRELKMSFRESEIYSKVRFGGSNTQVEAGVYEYPDIPFYNFKEEEYHLLGECNVENELDLVGDWIVDSNVIEDILVNANADYDEDIVLVTAQLGGTDFQAIAYNTFAGGGGSRVYNVPFNNQGVAERYLGFIPKSIAQFLGVSGGGFIGFDANRQTQTTHNLTAGSPTYNEEPAEFNDVAFNDGNYTATPDYRYTATALGYYQFWTRSEILITAMSSGAVINLDIRMKRFNSGNTLLETKTLNALYSSGGIHIENYFDYFVLNAGDYVHIRYEFTLTLGASASFNISTDSTFTSKWVADLGGIVQEYDPDDYHIYDFDAPEYPMSLADWFSVAAQPAGSFILNQEGTTATDIITFADKVDFRPFAGKADLRTFSKYNGF